MRMMASLLAAKLRCACCGTVLKGSKLSLRDSADAFVDARVCLACHAIVPFYSASGNEIVRQVKYHEECAGWRSETPETLWALRDQMVAVLSHFEAEGLLPPPSAGVLVYDIGAGRGNLVAAAVHRGYCAKACEPSTKLTAAAREVFGLSDGVLETSEAAPFIARHENDIGTVSGVFLWHVLEHMLDPVGVMRSLKPFLKSDGVFLIQGPLLSNKHLYREHRFLHSIGNILWLANRVGMKLVHIDMAPQEQFVGFALALSGHPLPDLAPSLDEVSLDAVSNVVNELMARHGAMTDILKSAQELAVERLVVINHMGSEIRQRDDDVAALRAEILGLREALEAASTEEIDPSAEFGTATPPNPAT